MQNVLLDYKNVLIRPTGVGGVGAVLFNPKGQLELRGHVKLDLEMLVAASSLYTWRRKGCRWPPAPATLKAYPNSPLPLREMARVRAFYANAIHCNSVLA
jgi:hypothetical protein